MNHLTNKYETILQNTFKEIDYSVFKNITDEYSGIFLPSEPAEKTSSKRIMLVGRETAGWNTKNKKNTIHSVIRAMEDKTISNIVKTAINRHQKHLDGGPGKSKFKQFYFRIAKELNINPKEIIYANLLAWDYQQKTILARPETEHTPLIQISIQLLATQIKYFKPDFIIFATGIRCDHILHQLINTLTNNKTEELYKRIEPFASKKIWTFKMREFNCFRIAHPRSTGDHRQYRNQVINIIKNAAINFATGKYDL